MRNKAIFIWVLGCLLALSMAIPVYADPSPTAPVPPPHAFYGTVSINGSPAPVGTVIEVRGTNVLTGINGNPITTTENGRYGSETNPLAPRLLAMGNIEAGTPLTFFVNGYQAPNTSNWQSGVLEPQNLTVTYSTGGGGGGVVTTTPAKTTVPAAPTSLPPAVTTSPAGQPGGVFDLSQATDSSGKFLSDFIASSADGIATISFAAGTVITTAGGAPLGQITIQKAGSPPGSTDSASSFASGAIFYDFAPAGAKFSPSARITFIYDPARIPAGVTPFIAWWNTSSGQWEKLDTVSYDPVKHTITAAASHFTVFGVLFERKPQVTAAGVTSVPPTSAPSPAVPSPAASSIAPPTSGPAKTTSNIGLIAGLSAACVVLIAIVVVLLVRRRQKKE